MIVLLYLLNYAAATRIHWDYNTQPLSLKIDALPQDIYTTLELPMKSNNSSTWILFDRDVDEMTLFIRKSNKSHQEVKIRNYYNQSQPYSLIDIASQICDVFDEQLLRPKFFVLFINISQLIFQIINPGLNFALLIQQFLSDQPFIQIHEINRMYVSQIEFNTQEYAIIEKDEVTVEETIEYFMSSLYVAGFLAINLICNSFGAKSVVTVTIGYFKVLFLENTLIWTTICLKRAFKSFLIETFIAGFLAMVMFFWVFYCWTHGNKQKLIKWPLKSKKNLQNSRFTSNPQLYLIRNLNFILILKQLIQISLVENLDPHIAIIPSFTLELYFCLIYSYSQPFESNGLNIFYGLIQISQASIMLGLFIILNAHDHLYDHILVFVAYLIGVLLIITNILQFFRQLFQFKLFFDYINKTLKKQDRPPKLSYVFQTQQTLRIDSDMMNVFFSDYKPNSTLAETQHTSIKSSKSISPKYTRRKPILRRRSVQEYQPMGGTQESFYHSTSNPIIQPVQLEEFYSQSSQKENAKLYSLGMLSQKIGLEISDTEIDFLPHEDQDELATQFEYINLIVETLKEDQQPTYAWTKLLEVSRQKLKKYLMKKNVEKIREITNILRETFDKSFQ